MNFSPNAESIFMKMLSDDLDTVSLAELEDFDTEYKVGFTEEDKKSILSGKMNPEEFIDRCSEAIIINERETERTFSRNVTSKFIKTLGIDAEDNPIAAQRELLDLIGNARDRLAAAKLNLTDEFINILYDKNRDMVYDVNDNELTVTDELLDNICNQLEPNMNNVKKADYAVKLLTDTMLDNIPMEFLKVNFMEQALDMFDEYDELTGICDDEDCDCEDDYNDYDDDLISLIKK